MYNTGTARGQRDALPMPCRRHIHTNGAAAIVLPVFLRFPWVKILTQDWSDQMPSNFGGIFFLAVQIHSRPPFSSKKSFFASVFFKTAQMLAAPDTTAPSSDERIWGKNIDLHQKLNRLDLSSTSRRIRQCKNISPTPIQWPRMSTLVQTWHVLTS